MNFLLTQYIYPIRNPIKISTKHQFSLDNPRTDEEIDAVYNYISKSYDINHEYDMGGPRIPIENSEDCPDGFMSLEHSLSLFLQNYGQDNEYINIFFNNNSELSVFKIISKMWIIARYDDGGASKKLDERSKELEQENPNARYITILRDEHPLVSIPKKLINFSTLLSLLIQKDLDELFTKSFIIQKDYETIRDCKIDTLVNNSILMFAICSYRKEINHDSDYWYNFHFAKDLIINYSLKLDTVKEENQEKILDAVSEILASHRGTFVNPKHELVSLTSILEMLLTHNPDYNRFNVEDSISKQFKLKTCLILYLNDTSISLESVHKRLGEIYSQRSNIAHGNFSALEKFIQKKYKEKLKEDPDYEKSFVIETLNSDLFYYIKVVIHKFLDDPTFIKYLKQN